MLVKRQALRFVAVGAVVGMLLAGCSGQDADEATVTPTEDAVTSTASPIAPEVNLAQYAEALVTDRSLMGVAHDPPVEGFVDDPVTMYLTLSEFEPTGECAELLDELNSFTAPAVGGVAAKFTRDADSATPSPEDTAATQTPEDDTADPADDDQDGAATQTLIFETTDPIEPMAIYRDIPNACETLSSNEVEGAEATFTKVPGLDALHLEISDGDEVETLAVGGSSVNAKFHFYMTAEQVTMEEAQEMFGAQAEKLQETFPDQVSSGASPAPTDTSEPSEVTTEPAEPDNEATNTTETGE